MSSGVSPGTFAAVAIGGAAGGLLRLLGLTAWPPAGDGLPLALLAINTAGSALIGLVLAFSEPGGRRSLSPAWSVGLMAGFCGALTTFSTFALELLSLVRLQAVLYLVISLPCWLGAAALGLVFGRMLNRRPKGGAITN